MRTKSQSRAELYGTSQVAEILSIPEWRVKNFSEGAAYRLPPAHRVGSGRGSRRLYGWADIYRIAIADHLVTFGFTAEAVGCAIREIPESVLRNAPYEEMLRLKNPDTEGLSAKETPLLISTGGGTWQVRKASEVGKEVQQTLNHTESARGLFALNLATFCDRVWKLLEQYWSK
jgi:hypothetical protein